MKKVNLKSMLCNWKPGNYFRELSVVVVGVFITLAATNFISETSQEKQIKETMLMIKMELTENLKEINKAESEYLREIAFFQLLQEKQDSIRSIKASVLEENINAPYRVCDLTYSEDALEVLKTSALMQQISDKQFILKLLQAYKQCRIIKRDNDFYYEYKEQRMNRHLNRNTNKDKIRKYREDIYGVWEKMLDSPEFQMTVITTPNTFDENPFLAPQTVIKEVIQLINKKYVE